MAEQECEGVGFWKDLKQCVGARCKYDLERTARAVVRWSVVEGGREVRLSRRRMHW